MFKTILTTVGFLASLAGPAKAEDPVHLVVSLKEQRLRVFKGTEEIASSNISSGKAKHGTPTGIFSILQKRRHHRSNIYDASMPHMQRLTWSGIALHASGNVPRYPASHGCVRLPSGFAAKLFKMDTRGVHVTIEQDPQFPAAILHRNLFQPVRTWSVDPKYDRWLNEYIATHYPEVDEQPSKKPLRILFTRRTQGDDVRDVQRLLNNLGYDAGEEDGLMGPASAKAIMSYQRAQGLKPNGLITAKLMIKLFLAGGEEIPKNGRILVRRGFKPVLEAEVELEDPQFPLGSHLITATNFDRDAHSTDWLAVSLEDRVYRQINLKGGLKIEPETNRILLSDTLDRIKIDDGTRRRISQMLTPGSSIAISDNGVSGETGEIGTDFVVVSKPGLTNAPEVARTSRKPRNS
jgi:peptidoglycan hydrolase-like protein with peptidoglycan-binding domain